jgi:hypothetical protein
VIEARKRAISIRMSTTDLRKVKKLAQRLNVRDSDVIRFAIKGMLARLGPLHEPEARGRNLVPVFVEAGAELLRFFDLDAVRLEAIINADVEPERRVAKEDIALLAMTGIQEPYAALKLSELNHSDERFLRTGDLAASLRGYLYDKYVYRPGGETEALAAITDNGASAGSAPTASAGTSSASTPNLVPLPFAMAAGGHRD